MFRRKLKFQILFSVLFVLLGGILALYLLSTHEIKENINKQQLSIYTEKIDTILQTLETKYQKLQNTQMVESYEHSFKEFAIKEIREVHYNESLSVYPFMINEKRIFILHPTLNGENYETYASNEDYKRIIKVKEDDFYLKYQGIDKWVVFKHFKKWDWIVGYSMPISLKYASLRDFTQKFLLLTLLIVSLIAFFIILIVRYVLSPIERLIFASKRIIEGDLQSEIKINGSYELVQLSNSFSLMKDTIKQNIDELEHKIQDRTVELTESNDELEQTISNLKQTQSKLIESEKMASLGGLVAGVAHEINTPVGVGLTGITHFLDVTHEIEKKYTSGDMSQEEFEEYLHMSKELAKQINTNLERTAHLVRSFKQVAVDQTSEEKRKFEIKRYFEEVILSLHNVVKKTNIAIELKSTGDINIYSYPGAYSQILTNLILNSINHAYDEKEQGIITIDLSKGDGYVKIIYKDDGKGIKEKDMPYIYEPFFTTNREKGGTGLGLNIVYNIITSQLKGTISCTSEIGEGVTFEITIPLLQK